MDTSSVWFKRIVGALLGLAAAYAVAVAAATAYHQNDMGDALVSLGLPPLVLFLIYRGSEKQLVFGTVSLLVSGLLFDVAPSLGMPRAGLGLVFITIAAMALPVALDLSMIDMGRRIRIGRPLAVLAQVAFVVAVVPLAGWKLSEAHREILHEDWTLLESLASRITPEGNTLVVERLDPRTREMAQQRIGIRTKDKTYALSDADVESVRRRVVRKTTPGNGQAPTEVTEDQAERMRLILKLQGTALPDDVVLYSHRGPRTIHEVRVPLSGHHGS